jgi:isopentenyldiphosphate isomerase
MAELLDVVDDEDNVVGKATRGQCHDKRLTHRSVMFFILDSSGRVLVNRRAKDKEFFGGQWSIVLGGHVPTGESYDEAVVREALEEAGLTLKPERVGYFMKRLRQECENVAVYAFTTDSKPKLLREEIEHGEFMTVGEAEAKMRSEEFIPETMQLLPILKQYLTQQPD